ncbi:H2B.U histone 2-like [Lepidochelys kempii]|uniref:H2B.U histone 2-like n=1 Tax=Lepidochelys kempii TaxID=8472 RepID=UPI003C6F1E3B
MAAAQTRKKKAQIRRRQKTQQMMLQKPQPKWKTSQPQQGGWKPVLKRLRKSRGKRRFSALYISEMMGRLQRGNRRMSAKAKGLMNSSMCSLYSGVFTEADRRRKKRRGSFIGTSEVQAALEKVMKGNVANYSITSIHSKSR